MHENRETSETPTAKRPQVGGRRQEPHGPRVRFRGVTQRHSTYEPFEQRRGTVSGECGGKAADQGERLSTSHVLDTEREGRVPGAGGRAESSKGKQGEEVHRLAPPSDRRSAAGKFLLTEEEGRTRSRWRNVAGV